MTKSLIKLVGYELLNFLALALLVSLFVSGGIAVASYKLGLFAI